MVRDPPAPHRPRTSRSLDRLGNHRSLKQDSEGPEKGFLVVNADRQYQILRGLASPLRLRIMRHLLKQGPLNINQIAKAFRQPQSTIASNIQILEETGLIETKISKASKGQQKICYARYSEIVVKIDPEATNRDKDIIEVEMPLGLYTTSNVSAPCGLCSTEKILGMLDVPELFLDPARVKAALVWFGRGYIEYKFPNNAKVML
jgi:predicted transcriptional regulator